MEEENVQSFVMSAEHNFFLLPVDYKPGLKL